MRRQFKLTDKIVEHSFCRNTMAEVVSGLQRQDPSGGGLKVPVSVEDAVKIVEDLTRIH